MDYYFHPEAEAELEAAVRYYESRQFGLGIEFLHEVESAIQNIVSFPDAWPKLDVYVRRCLMSRFPFGIVYTDGQNHIYILAVMNLRQKPNYWKARHR